MGYPVLEHVSLPRMGAMQTILDTLNVNNTENGMHVYIVFILFFFIEMYNCTCLF